MSEKLLKYQKIHRNNENGEGASYLISEYTTHCFGMDILDTCTCWSCHQKNNQNQQLRKDWLFTLAEYCLQIEF